MSYRSIILLVVATLNLLYQQGWLSPQILTPVDPNSVTVQHDGFRVLFLEESEQRPTWWLDLYNNSETRAYLDSHCEGGKEGYRKWDASEAKPNAPAEFQEMLTVPRTSLPSVVVSANKRATPLAVSDKTTDAEFLATLKKYGGDQ